MVSFIYQKCSDAQSLLFKLEVQNEWMNNNANISLAWFTMAKRAAAVSPAPVPLTSYENGNRISTKSNWGEQPYNN